MRKVQSAPNPPDSFTKEEGIKAVGMVKPGDWKTVTQAEFEDMVNHPSHYTSHPSGVEVIDITKHENFCIGNAIKYLMRYKIKGNPKQDLKKAVWYINKELENYAD